MPIKCLKAVNTYPNIVLCFIEILKIWLPLKGLLILKSKKANIKKIVTPKWVSDMFSSLFYLHQCSLIFQFEHCTFLPSQHLYFVLLGVCVIILAIEYKLLIWDKKTYQWLSMIKIDEPQNVWIGTYVYIHFHYVYSFEKNDQKLI